VDCGSGQQGKNLYSSFIYRLKPGFGRFFRGACKPFWNVLLRKDTQVWENDVLMITGLQAYKTTGDALIYTKNDPNQSFTGPVWNSLEHSYATDCLLF
jgi:hypothetical protein